MPANENVSDNNNEKPVLVCGGAGYIGSHMVRFLASAGRLPVIVDNLSEGHRASVPDGVELIVASVGDKDAMNRVFDRYDFGAVLHLCANTYVGESVENPRKYYHNNIANGLALLEAMVEHDVRNMVFSSSCAVYGYPDHIPINESCRFAPISPYGHTKAMFEQILADFDRAYGLKSVSLRYFNASGAIAGAEIGEDHSPESHLIPLVLFQAMQQMSPPLLHGDTRTLRVFGDDYDTPDGTCIRDYIHVTDLASAHHAAIDYLSTGGDSVAVNLGNGEGFSVLDIIAACEEISGVKIPYEITARRPGDPDRLVGDATKAKNVLGWTPQHSDLQNIIQTAWQWHKTHPGGYASK